MVSWSLFQRKPKEVEVIKIQKVIEIEELKALQKAIELYTSFCNALSVDTEHWDNYTPEYLPMVSRTNKFEPDKRALTFIVTTFSNTVTALDQAIVLNSRLYYIAVGLEKELQVQREEERIRKRRLVNEEALLIPITTALLDHLKTSRALMTGFSRVKPGDLVNMGYHKPKKMNVAIQMKKEMKQVWNKLAKALELATQALSIQKSIEAELVKAS